MTFNKLTSKEIIIIAVATLIMLLAIIFTVLFVRKESERNRSTTVVEALGVVPVNYSTPTSTFILSETEFYALQQAGIMDAFETYESYSANAVGAEMSFKTSDITATGWNAEIYDIVNENFNVWYGGMRVSPILPMAISNIETPGRADHSITWCSLFPSRIVPIDLLHEFDVTYVISNDDWYRALSSEYSTRDRGALQMSPTYGTSNGTINDKMSGTEKEKLAAVDTSRYSSWVSGASSYPGDRFYLPDVCLRMTCAFSTQTVNMQKNNYVPTTDMNLVAMLAISHQSSGVWGNKNHSAACGCWRSSELAYEWCKLISDKTMVDYLVNLASSTDATFIDTKQAQAICNELNIANFSKYSTKSIVCTYPIKVLYSYIKLCMLYTE